MSVRFDSNLSSGRDPVVVVVRFGFVCHGLRTGSSSLASLSNGRCVGFTR